MNKIINIPRFFYEKIFIIPYIKLIINNTIYNTTAHSLNVRKHENVKIVKPNSANIGINPIAVKDNTKNIICRTRQNAITLLRYLP